MLVRPNFLYGRIDFVAKYDYVILPPDVYHMTLRDRLVDSQQLMADALDVVDRLKGDGQTVLVKYRSKNQPINFPCAAESQVEYGPLLDYCSSTTIVIGFPGSAALDCLLSDIPFYAFWNYQCYQGNRFVSMEAVTRLLDVIYIARTNAELYENIVNRTIFKPGRKKNDLLHSNGMSLQEIIQEIFKRQKRESHT